MTKPSDSGGSDPAPATTHADRLPTDGTSITAARAVAVPATVDRAARTVEVVWSTGARARNYVPPLGLITEELDMSPNAVRMEGLSGGGAPVLNTHRSGDARDVVGRVIAARLEAGRGIATLQFSSATDVEPLWQRIADGTLRSVSVGYRVHRYEQVADVLVGTVHRAVDWEPYEISVVPLPVDPAAAVRGASDAPPVPAVEPAISDPTPIPTQENTMPDPADTTATTTTTGQEANPTMTTIPVAAPVASSVTAVTPPAAPDLDAIRAEADRAATERIASYDPVLAAARGLVLDDQIDAQRQAAIRERMSADVLRGRLWDAFAQRGRAAPPTLPANPAAGPASQDPEVIRDAMAEALAVRAMPGYQASGGASGRHAEFLGWRPSEMVAELMRARGERNIPRDTAKLAERAFQTTSDFPLLLSAAANKMLLAAYAPANPTYRQIFLRRDFRDFKPHRHLRVGDFPNLVPLSESGEIQAGTMSESQELVALTTFARRIRVTRPMLVNDDLGAFTDFAAMIGRRVADFENVTAYGLLNTANGDGPTLTTGATAVFATGAARANKAASGTALDLTNLAAGRAAVMKQKTLDGLPISVGSSMQLVVGPNQELAARQLTVSVQANQTSNVNIYAGFIQPLVEPLIPSNRWYLFSDAVSAPVYVYGYLNGAEGPQVTTGPVSGVDGVEVSVIFDFGVGAIDWRGAWFNPGT
ncbi:MAG: terminase [Acetobacteraceae bacterium]|nr:terminase [Acetobacteraceae bacterium]